MTADPAFLKKVEAISRALDQLDYFQLLAIAPDADAVAIRDAYHRQSRRFHPDRYHHLGDAQLVADLTRISRRITEAYVVLRDERKRKSYEEGLAGPAREGRLRYREQDEIAAKEQREQEMGKTPQVRQFFRAAQVAHVNGDLDDAINSLRLALLYEPDNDAFKTLLAEWQGQKKQQPPPSAS
jgi:curved DNA-binding protein CbpA